MPPSGPPDPASLDRPWTEAYPPGVPTDYRLPDVALPRFLDDAVRDFPHRAALVAEAGPIGHVAVRDRVNGLAEVLRASGVRHGDRVLVGVPNGASLPVVWFAVWRLAAVVVTVPHDVDASRLRAIAVDTGAVAAVGSRRFARSLPAEPEGPAAVIVVDDDGWLFPPRPHRLRRLVAPLRRERPPADHLEGRMRLERTLDAVVPGSGAPMDPGPVVADDLAMISYGQTGPVPSGAAAVLSGAAAVLSGDGPVLSGDAAAPPDGSTDLDTVRGTAWTHASLVAGAFQARLWVPDIQAGSERILVAASLAGPVGPTAAVLGPLLGSLAGAAVVCVPDLDDADLVRAVERHGPTLLVLRADRVGALLTEDAAKRDLSSLRVVLAIGTELDPELATAVERRTRGARVRGCVGLDGAAITHAQPVYGRSVPGSMGIPVTGTVAAIVDPDHLEVVCPPGRAGRLVVHGPQLAAGAGAVGGWLVSRELAVMDDDGVFHHLGAIGEVVERAGTWVSPRRIEAVLLRHPAVRRAGVVAGSRPGSLLAAVVCTRRGRPAVEELLVHCRAHLDSPAVPDDVILLDDLPDTPTGDLAREDLRALLIGR